MEPAVHLHNFSSTDSSSDGDSGGSDVGWSNTTIYVYNLINFTTGNDTDYFLQQPPLVIQILGRVYIISVPIIIILGVIGNILAFCIFASKSLRRTSCSIYLAARSFSDSGFLVSLFISWLGDASKIPIIHVTVMCQLVIFTSYFFAFLSVWLVVFITMENYIRICHPFSVAKFCNVQKARQILVALVLLGVILYQFALWMTHVDDFDGSPRCGNKEQFMVVMTVVTYGDLIITLVVPSIIILFLMVAITVSLVRSFKRQSRLKGKKQATGASNSPAVVANESMNGGTSNNRQNGRKGGSCMRCSSPQAKVTRLLFAVSFTFLLLSLPSHLVRLRIIMLALAEEKPRTPSVEEKLQVVFQILYYLSFAVNLIVYLSFGESFRSVFIDTYISRFLNRRAARRRSEISHTTYTAVKIEQQDYPPREEETSLVT